MLSILIMIILETYSLCILAILVQNNETKAYKIVFGSIWIMINYFGLLKGVEVFYITQSEEIYNFWMEFIRVLVFSDYHLSSITIYMIIIEAFRNLKWINMYQDDMKMIFYIQVMYFTFKLFSFKDLLMIYILEGAIIGVFVYILKIMLNEVWFIAFVLLFAGILHTQGFYIEFGVICNIFIVYVVPFVFFMSSLTWLIIFYFYFIVFTCYRIAKIQKEMNKKNKKFKDIYKEYKDIFIYCILLMILAFLLDYLVCYFLPNESKYITLPMYCFPISIIITLNAPGKQFETKLMLNLIALSTQMTIFRSINIL
jgi:hypothetical protein